VVVVVVVVVGEWGHYSNVSRKFINAELNPICYLLALSGTHHIFHVSRIRINQKKDKGYFA